MRKTAATLMVMLVIHLPALAGTRSIQGIVTEAGDKTFKLQVIWYAAGTPALSCSGPSAEYDEG